jgi:hypothetical protein
MMQAINSFTNTRPNLHILKQPFTELVLTMLKINHDTAYLTTGYDEVEAVNQLVSWSVSQSESHL